MPAAVMSRMLCSAGDRLGVTSSCSAKSTCRTRQDASLTCLLALVIEKALRVDWPPSMINDHHVRRNVMCVLELLLSQRGVWIGGRVH